jgi:SAM-dependent methyltransferase
MTLDGDYARRLPGLRTRALPLSLGALRKYLTREATPSRLLCDLAVAEYLPRLEGPIIEIGATRKGNYRRFARPGTDYTFSNITREEGTLYLDVMRIDLPDASVDNYVSIVTLEHVPDPERAVREITRTLKPGGGLLLVVPFMFPFHAAPSDFFRFTDAGLAVLLRDYEVLAAEALGNVFSTGALYLQRPFGWTPPERGSLGAQIHSGLVNGVSMALGSLFYLLSYSVQTPDDYPFLHCVLARKR